MSSVLRFSGENPLTSSGVSPLSLSKRAGDHLACNLGKRQNSLSPLRRAQGPPGEGPRRHRIIRHTPNRATPERGTRHAPTRHRPFDRDRSPTRRTGRTRPPGGRPRLRCGLRQRGPRRRAGVRRSHRPRHIARHGRHEHRQHLLPPPVPGRHDGRHDFRAVARPHDPRARHEPPAAARIARHPHGTPARIHAHLRRRADHAVPRRGAQQLPPPAKESIPGARVRGRGHGRKRGHRRRTGGRHHAVPARVVLSARLA